MATHSVHHSRIATLNATTRRLHYAYLPRSSLLKSLSVQTIHYTLSYTTIPDPGRPYHAPLKDVPTEL
jgi:hypothetical protein